MVGFSINKESTVEKDLSQRWQQEWQKNPKRNLCVCYDVPKEEVMQAIEKGASSLEEVSSQTYACQGAGCCERQVERLLEFYRAQEQPAEDKESN
ncbi:(2Fe-2S)-binding protein [Thiomicrorhabdus sp. 6S3-12]|nr:(2Fe-2S)-binding protein [Thiomicrorhabdus sp. 6S3-12]MBO1924857.1 (2Fe-2S)-binding protein [Thiomicrorhabdus sp. 6S3-12]